MSAPDTDRPADGQLLADLCARVHALEAWRAYQSDLLDELLNGLPATPEDTPLDETDPDDSDGEIDLDGLVLWVHATVTSVIARPLRGELTWCSRWWEHPEAVLRLEALRRAWTELAPEPGASMSIWIRDHLDPCLRELLSMLGPFADCAHGSRLRAPSAHTPLPTLPSTVPD